MFAKQETYRMTIQSVSKNKSKVKGYEKTATPSRASQLNSTLCTLISVLKYTWWWELIITKV